MMKNNILALAAMMISTGEVFGHTTIEDRVIPSREESDMIAKENLEKHYKSLGLSCWEINGKEVWARNYKNALRKANKK